jgi:hypothetical protein
MGATWLIGLYSPQLGKTISRYKVDGGDATNSTRPTTLRTSMMRKPFLIVEAPSSLPRRQSRSNSFHADLRWSGSVRDGYR